MIKFAFKSLVIFTSLFMSVVAYALPKGFTVTETNHRSHIVFIKNFNGRVVVQIDNYSLQNTSFIDLVNQISSSNGNVSCTKMKDYTPLGGPRFHCQENLTRTPYTLHLTPRPYSNSVLYIVISGDNYPGFGITYDDVNALIDYWDTYD